MPPGVENCRKSARIPQDELRALLVGYGHEPYFVEGDDPETMHQLMAETLEQAQVLLVPAHVGDRHLV